MQCSTRFDLPAPQQSTNRQRQQSHKRQIYGSFGQSQKANETASTSMEDIQKLQQQKVKYTRRQPAHIIIMDTPGKQPKNPLRYTQLKPFDNTFTIFYFFRYTRCAIHHI